MIKSFFISENLFLDVHPQIRESIAKDVKFIQLLLDNLDVFLLVYYQILGNIKKYIN